PSGQSLADIRPGLLEPKCFVHVADEHVDVVATFLTRGLDVVLEYVLPYPISVLGCSRRVTRQEPPVLSQPATPVGEPVVGIVGVRHEDPVVLTACSGILTHLAQTLAQRLEPVSFPCLVEIPMRHSKCRKISLDGSDRVSPRIAARFCLSS